MSRANVASLRYEADALFALSVDLLALIICSQICRLFQVQSHDDCLIRYPDQQYTHIVSRGREPPISNGSHERACPPEISSRFPPKPLQYEAQKDLESLHY